MLNNKHNSRLNGWERCSQPFFFGDIKTGLNGEHGSFWKTEEHENMLLFEKTEGVSGNLVGISINLCKSIQKELFINDTP